MPENIAAACAAEYPRRSSALPDHLYAALGRLARLAQGQEPSELLSTALREASVLVGVRLLVLRLPDGPAGYTEVRWPANAAWPSARQVTRWHGQVAQSAKPVRIGGG